MCSHLACSLWCVGFIQVVKLTLQMSYGDTVIRLLCNTRGKRGGGDLRTCKHIFKKPYRGASYLNKHRKEHERQLSTPFPIGPTTHKLNVCTVRLKWKELLQRELRARLPSLFLTACKDTVITLLDDGSRQKHTNPVQGYLCTGKGGKGHIAYCSNHDE